MYRADLALRLSKIGKPLSRREHLFHQKLHDLNETIYRNALVGTAGTAFTVEYFSSGEFERVKAMGEEAGWQFETVEKDGNPPAYVMSVPNFPQSRELSEAELEELTTTNIYIRDQAARARGQFQTSQNEQDGPETRTPEQ